MKYDDEIKAILAESAALALNTRRLGWSIARTIPDAKFRTVTARIKKMQQENEVFRRLPRAEIDRIWQQIEIEETTARQLAAGVARRNVEPTIAGLERRHRAYVAARRRDVSLSCRMRSTG